MELDIQNFKGIKNKKITFDKLFYLLKGPSGSGKSTVCEAIKFVLYNSSRNIKPLDSKGKTLVNLKYLDLDITRSKNPESLVCYKKDKKYVNGEAENIILENFDNLEIWTLSSYIAQDKRNIFLESSNIDKLELLKKIVFKDSLTSSIKFNKLLDNLIDKLVVDIQSKDKMIDYLEDKIKLFLDNNSDIVELYNRALEYKDLDNSIYLNKQKLENYYKYTEYKDSKIDLKAIENRLNKGYPKNLNLQYIQDWKEYLACKEEIDNFNPLENKESLEKLKLEYSQSKNNLKIKEKFSTKNVNKLKETIGQKITFLNNQKTAQKLTELREYLSGLESTFLKLEAKWHQISQTFYERVVPFTKMVCESFSKNYLSENIQSFSCPYCQKCLYLKNDKLEPRPVILDKKSKESYRKLMANLNNIIDYKNIALIKIADLEKKIIKAPENPELDFKIDPKDPVKFLELTLLELEAYNEDCRDLKSIEKDLEYYRVYDKYNRLKKFKKSFFSVPEDFDLYYKNYNSDSQNYKKFKNLDIESLKDFHPDIIQKLESLKLAMVKYEPIIKDKKELENLKNKRLLAIKNLENSRRLKTVYNETINKYLENNIENINTRLNSILESMFDNLNIYIRLFKEVKGQKNKEKALVNFVVVMNGIEYPNFNYFSGGEKDRISIALTLTFNIILGSPILIFDEVFSSLEESKRIECLKAIKKYSPGKILINVCHETIEGYYDRIIDF